MTEKMDKPNKFLVFDVESIGLHGEGFAVGWVLVEGREQTHEGRFSCPPDQAGGHNAARYWVKENIPRIFPDDCRTPKQVRDRFWELWDHHRLEGALLVADCAWPVEARFLAACVDDDPGPREWGGPYPLHDLASIVLAKGGDPMATRERTERELPIHDPLADARQSARLLVEALREE